MSLGRFERGLALADLDGDGRLDIITVVYSSDPGPNLFVLRNLSSAGVLDANSFAAPVQFVAPDYLWAVALGDLDGDGKPDLVTTSEAEQSVWVRKNTSSPGMLNGSSFPTAVPFFTGLIPEAVAIGDLDGDGRPTWPWPAADQESCRCFGIRSPPTPLPA